MQFACIVINNVPRWRLKSRCKDLKWNTWRFTATHHLKPVADTMRAIDGEDPRCKGRMAIGSLTTVISFSSGSVGICCICRTVSDHWQSREKIPPAVGIFTRCITARRVTAVVACVLQLGSQMSHYWHIDSPCQKWHKTVVCQKRLKTVLCHFWLKGYVCSYR